MSQVGSKIYLQAERALAWSAGAQLTVGLTGQDGPFPGRDQLLTVERTESGRSSKGLILHILENVSEKGGVWISGRSVVEALGDAQPGQRRGHFAVSTW